VRTTAPADAREALDMIRAGLGYLAAADPARLPAATQAECLRELEQHNAVLTAARAWMLAAFTAGQGHAGDGDYSAVSWLTHRTGIQPRRRRRAYRVGQADRHAPAGPGAAGRGDGLRIGRAADLPVG
jgi:1,6-anhydro-N-acetylmuramate kinase